MHDGVLLYFSIGVRAFWNKKYQVCLLEWTSCKAHKITYISQTHFIFINGIIIKSVAYATAFNGVTKLKRVQDS